MSYAIMRLEKMKSTQIKPSQRHNNRQNKNYSNPDIRMEDSDQNLYLKKSDDFKVATQKVLDKNYKSEKTIRKDAILNIEVLVTSDKVFFDDLNKDEKNKYFEKSLEFLENKYGKENIINAVVHYDETTPHMHVNFVPVTKDGRLSAKEVIGNRGDMQKLQTDFYEHISKDFDYLERGISVQETNRKGKSLSEFKKETKWIDEKLKIEQNKLNVLTQNLEKKGLTIKQLERVNNVFDSIKKTEKKKLLSGEKTYTIDEKNLKYLEKAIVKNKDILLDLKKENKRLYELHKKADSRNDFYETRIENMTSFSQNLNLELRQIGAENTQLKKFIEDKKLTKELDQFQKKEKSIKQKKKEQEMER